MPIQESNIVFVESQVMDDVPEGGGAASGRVIEDGKMNNIFPDISDLDRAYGRFGLRKIFLAIRTLFTDLYGGAKTVITALPQDDALGYTLFSNSDPFDTREQAADKVEAYLYKGPMWSGWLYENHIAGMRTINLLQKVGTQVPPVGKTLCLVANEGIQGEIEQYIRVTKVDVVERTFVDGVDTSGKDIVFNRLVVTLTLSDALRYDFKGHEIRRLDRDYLFTAGETRVRDTSVADATRYYGAQRLATTAGIGDLAVRASSIFTPLVPSAQTETPLTNRPLNPSLTVTLSAGTRTVEVAQQAHTLARNVTAESRRLTWVENLQPIPAPGALSISYRAQGNWHELTDNGLGTISGTDPTIGAGTINYETGVMSLTLGALPDVGSQVMWAWGSPVHYTSLLPEDTLPAQIVIESPRIQTQIKPGTLVLTWVVDGVTKTATDNSAGALTGDATGTVDYTLPRIAFSITKAPDHGTGVTVDYESPPASIVEAPPTSTPTTEDYQTASAMSPFTVSALVNFVLPDGSASWDITARDDGTGNMRVSEQIFEGWYFENRQIVGTVDYATGKVSINSTTTLKRREYYHAPGTGSVPVGIPTDFRPSAGQWIVVETGSVPLLLIPGSLRYTPAGALPGGVTPPAVPETVITAPPDTSIEVAFDAGFGPKIKIGDMTIRLVPNSLEFIYGGKTYQDRNGTLYADINPTTGSGIVAGTVNYTTGATEVTFYNAGATGSPVITSALGVYGQWVGTGAAFRTAQAPIKPEALSITAATAGSGSGGASELITGSANQDGVIVGDKMVGQINYEMGTAWVEFGEMVEGEWKPTPVQPETIRYNAVAYSYLPLDANILGIDPVRLPSDGRVPIYRPGDVVMVMHTTETAPQTVSNGGTIDCGRTRIGWIRVIDATGASKPTGFTLDRATGIVTFQDVSGMTMPIKVRHTVGDLRQITDAQITGQLTLARPLTHNFPSGESIVASCLIHGDRRARVSSVWDQATWNGTWGDSLVGSEATATLDVIAHPIEVTNEGAETERWLLRWTSTTNVELIGQRRGLVFSGPFTADIAPINPRTRNPDGTGGVPYLRIPVAANGGGWSTGNVVRINTVGALADIWIARSIQQSDEPLGDGEDGVELYALGNIDRP